MNKIYRVIFNKARGIFMVVSELTNSHSKEKSSTDAPSATGTVRTKGFALSTIFAAGLITAGIVVPWADANAVSIGVTNGGKISIDGWACGGNHAVLLNADGDASVNCTVSADAVAVGWNAQAKQEGGVVLGSGALIDGANAVAIGKNAQAYAYRYTDNGTKYRTPTSAVVIGNSATTNQQQSIVLGATSKVIATHQDEASSVVVGYGSRAIGQQAMVFGSTSGAVKQSLAVGGDVYAAGGSSIAIGNDDIVDPKYQDKLPTATILSIYKGLWENSDSNKRLMELGNSTTVDTFYNKYIQNAGGADQRIYSPTYAAKLGAIAIGSRTVAGGEVSTAVGSLSFALADRSTAMGIRSFVAAPLSLYTNEEDWMKRTNDGQTVANKDRGWNNLTSTEKAAFGNNSLNYTNLKTVIEWEAANPGKQHPFRVGAVGGTAVGENSYVFAPNSVAIGNKVEASNNGSFSYGYNAKAVGEGSLAMGYGSIAAASINDTIYKQLTSELDTLHSNNQLVKDDGSIDDAARTNYDNQIKQKIAQVDALIENGQLFNYDGNVYLSTSEKDIKKIATAKNNNAFDVNGDGTISANEVQGDEVQNAISIGRYSFALRSNTVAMGYAAIADSRSSLVIGSYAHATDEAQNSLVLGVNAYSSAANSLAIGYSSNVFGANGMALGMGARVAESATDGAAIGKAAQAVGVSTMAIGNGAKATLKNSVALGYRTITDYTDEELGKSGYAPKGTIAIPTIKGGGIVSVGSTTEPRRIAGLASGRLDTDAVNVAQLRSLDEKFERQIASIGNDEGVNFLSVDKTSANSEGGELASKFYQSADYDRYVRLKTMLVGFDLNQKLTDAEFDETELQNFRDEVENLGNKYGNTKSGTIKSVATSLAALDTEITNAVNELNGMQEGSAKEARRIELFTTIRNKIQAAGEADSARSYGDYTKEQLAEERANSNFDNDGAKGDDSIALGFKASTAPTVDKDNLAQAGGLRAIAVGVEANATGKGAIVIGSWGEKEDADGTHTVSQATGRYAIAVGMAAQANNHDAIAMGRGTSATQENAIAIGWLSKATGFSAIGLGEKNDASGYAAIGIGRQTTASGINSVAIGALSKATEDKAIAIGSDNNSEEGITAGVRSVAIGSGNKVTGSQAIAIGVGHNVSGANSGAFGDPNTVSGSGSYAFGNDNTISTDNTFVLGNNVTTTQANSVFLGNRSYYIPGVEENAYSRGLGGDPYTSATIGGIKYGNFFGGAAEGTAGGVAGVVSIASTTAGGVIQTRRLQGVAAGLIGANSTDAINGSQLFATNTVLSNVANKVGLTPINGIDGADGKDGASIAGADGVNGTNGTEGAAGVPGSNGTNGLTGPAGRDGLNDTTLANKVQSLRDGAAGTVVYTYNNASDATDTLNGERVLVENGKYYKPTLVNGKKKANNGLWYDAAKVDADGNLVAGTNVADGKKLSELATPTDIVPNTNVVLSTVNPDGKTTTPVTLGNVASVLGINPTAATSSDHPLQLGGAAITPEAAKTAIGNFKGTTDEEKGLFGLKGTALNRVVTAADLQALAVAGLNFKGDTPTDAVNVPLGQTLKIYGGQTDASKLTSSTSGNIGVEADTANAALVIRLAKTLTGLTEVKTDKLTLGSTGTVPSLTADGGNIKLSDNTRITNVADGVGDKDAVNLAQVKSLVSGGVGSADLATKADKATKIKLEGTSNPNNASNEKTLGADIAFTISGDGKYLETTTTAAGVSVGFKDTYKNLLDNLPADGKLAYKATNNGTTSDAQTVKLGDGLNFTGDKNITTSVAANGVVSFALKNALTGVNSIESEAYTIEGIPISQKTQITLGKEGVKLNSKVLSGLSAGKIGTDSVVSTEAVTGSQLGTLLKHLGLSVSGTGTSITAPTFTQVTGAARTSAPETFKAAIDDVIEVVNKGLLFSANQPATGTTTPITLALGKTLDITAAGANGITKTGSSPSVVYKGDNLITQAIKADASNNAKIEIGLKQDPDFNSVTVGAPTAAGHDNGITLTKSADDTLKLGSGSAGADKITLTNLKDGVNDSDAATVGQVKKVSDNTIQFKGNKPSAQEPESLTEKVSLSKDGGILFSIAGDTTTGKNDILATASGTSVTLNLNKITAAADFVSGATRVATAGVVYDAIKNAKPTISVASNSYLTIDKNGDRTGITGDDFTLKFNSDQLKTDIQNSLSGHFTIVDDHKNYQKVTATMKLSEQDVSNYSNQHGGNAPFAANTSYDILQFKEEEATNAEETLVRYFRVNVGDESSPQYRYFNTSNKEELLDSATIAKLQETKISTFLNRDPQSRNIDLNKGLKIEGDGFITVEYYPAEGDGSKTYTGNELTNAPILKFRASDAVNAALTKIAEAGGVDTGTINYKINSTSYTTPAFPGFHFIGEGDENITVYAGENSGEIKFKLEEALSKISSIGSGAADEALTNPERGARLSFTAGTKGADALPDTSDDVAPIITANNAKLTGLVDGRIGAGSSDAITGNQLFDLVGTNDNAHGSINYRITNLENGAAGPVVYTNDAGQVRYKAADGKYYSETNAQNIAESYVYHEGKWYAKDDTTYQTDKTSEVQSLADNNYSPTRLSLVGLAGGAKDDLITLSNVKSNVLPVEVAEKDIVQAAIEKYNQQQDVEALKISSADAANITTTEALKTKLDALKATATSSHQNNFLVNANTETLITAYKDSVTADVTAAKLAENSRKAVAGDDFSGTGGLYGITDSLVLNSAATVEDLQTVARAGLAFGDNSGAMVHRPLGTQLNIVGALNDDGNAGKAVTATDYSSDNLATFADPTNGLIRIGMLKNPSFTGVTLDNGLEGDDGAKLTLTPTKPTAGGDQGKTILNLSTGETPSDATTDDVIIRGVAKGSTGDSAVNKAQLDELAEKIGVGDDTPRYGIDGTNGPAGQDGLNGTSVVDKAEGLRNGIAGTVVYTKPDGTRLGYFVDSTGTGKFYELVGGKLPLDSNGKPTSAEYNDLVILSAVNSNGGTKNPDVVLSNIASTLTPAAASTVSALEAAIAQYNAGVPGDKRISPEEKNGITTLEQLQAKILEKYSTDSTTGQALSNQAKTAYDTKINELTVENARKAVMGENLEGTAPNSLYQLTGDQLDNAATMQDLQTVALSGLTFGDNSGATVHRRLGTQLNIVGALNAEGNAGKVITATNRDALYSSDNLATFADPTNGLIRIGMLKNPSFTGMTLNNGGNSALTLSSSADGTTPVLNLSKGTTAGDATGENVIIRGVKGSDEDDSAVNYKQLKDLETRFTAATAPATSGNTGVAGSNGHDGTAGNEGPAGKDGLDGKNLTDQVNAQRAGLSGNMVYTDTEGNRLVKINDTYYKADSVKDYKLGADGSTWYYAADLDAQGNPKSADELGHEPRVVTLDQIKANAEADGGKVDYSKVLISAVNPEDGETLTAKQKPVVLSNIGSGLTQKPEDNATAAPADVIKKVVDAYNATLTDAAVAAGKAPLDAANYQDLATLKTALSNASALGNEAAAQNMIDSAQRALDAQKVVDNARKIIAGDDFKGTASTTGLLATQDSDLRLDNAATVRDLKTLALSGLTFTDSNNASVHRPIGTALNIVGKKAAEGQTLDKSLYDQGQNLATFVDTFTNTMRIEMLKHPSFTGLTLDNSGATNGGAVTLTPTKSGDSTVLNLSTGTTPNADSTSDDVVIRGVAEGSTPDSAVNKAQLDALAAQVGSAHANGIDGQNGRDGAPGTAGLNGVPGANGKDGAGSTLVGPAGRDGLNGSSTASKVQALRDGAAGTVVYTNTQGERVLVENGKYYDTKLVTTSTSPVGTMEKDKATGLWYAEEFVKPDGTLDTALIEDRRQALDEELATATDLSEGEKAARREAFEMKAGGKTLSEVSAYVKGKSADSSNPVLKEGGSIKPEDVMLSAVNAKGQTTVPTTLANIRSGLGLTGDKDNNPAVGDTKLNNPEAITADAARKVIAGSTTDNKVDQSGNGGLYAKSGAELNKVATVGDLQAVARSGLAFVGNDGTEIHRPLGTTLKIIGNPEVTAYDSNIYSALNMITHQSDGSLVIEMKVKPTFEGIVLDGKGTDGQDGKDGYIGVDANGNVVVSNGKDGLAGTDGRDGMNGASRVITENDIKGGDGALAVNLSYKAGGEENAKQTTLSKGLTFNSTDENIKIATETEGKVNFTLNNNLTGINSISSGGENEAKITLTSGQNGADGQNGKPSVNVNGAVVTGLAEGTNANDAATVGQVNKVSNNVNNVMSQLGNLPLSYIKTVRQNGVDVAKRLVAGSDGQLYFADSEGKPDMATGPQTPTGIMLVQPDVENKATVGNAQTLGNVADGKIAAGSKEAINGGQLSDVLGATVTKEVVRDQNGNVVKDENGQNKVETKVTTKDGKDGIGGTGKNTISDAIAEINGKASRATNPVEIKDGKGTRVRKDDSGSTIVYRVDTAGDLEGDTLTLGKDDATTGEKAVKLSNAKGDPEIHKDAQVLNVNANGNENGTIITGVADGRLPTDAVNVRQLESSMRSVSNYLDNKINKVEKRSNAGTASAIAVASLPQAADAGKSMFSIAGGSYEGETATAIGISRRSDNGKVILKANGTFNSRGKMGVGVGVGFQW